jgi:hypothetical protein
MLHPPVKQVKCYVSEQTSRYVLARRHADEFNAALERGEVGTNHPGVLSLERIRPARLGAWRMCSVPHGPSDDDGLSFPPGWGRFARNSRAPFLAAVAAVLSH